MNEPMADISRHVWETKYRYAHERTIADSWRRIARALAGIESNDPVGWEARYFRILQDFKFLPGGRIQAGAGTARNVTLFNCFVMGPIEDSIPGIFRALQEGAVTMQQGGGIGLDFSTLRPRGTLAKGAGTVASGPVSFLWNHPVVGGDQQLQLHGEPDGFWEFCTSPGQCPCPGGDHS